MKLLLTGIAGILLAIGGYFGMHQVQAPQTTQAPLAGAFGPTGGGTYRLGQSIGTSDITFKLSSFKEPVSNVPYTMSYLNSDIVYGTISPQSSVSEFVSFTGITQNSDGSATLTGVRRGLSRTPAGVGCVASTTLAQPHSGQSIFIVSNSPCFYSEYTPLRTTATSSAVLVFGSTTPPRLDNDAIHRSGTYIATTSEFATYSLVAAIANAGTVNATNAVKGILQLATRLQAASSTALGSTGASLALTSAMATDTPQNCGNAATGGCVVVSDLTGKIKQAWINLTEQFTFSNLFATNASSTNATTTNLTVTGNTIGITRKFALTTSPSSAINSAATTSVFSYSVPANTLSTSNFIRARVYIRGYRVNTGSCTFLWVESSYGFGTTTLQVAPPNASNPDVSGAGYVDILLSAAGTTNAQKMTMLWQTNATSTPSSALATSTVFTSSNALTTDSTATKLFTLNVRFDSANAACWIIPEQVTAELFI